MRESVGRYGYKCVDHFASQPEVPGLGILDPDIIAVVDRRSIPIECEQGQGNRRDLLDRKS
jgi:hypothetical protein